jgi:hypothetical protein
VRLCRCQDKQGKGYSPSSAAASATLLNAMSRTGRSECSRRVIESNVQQPCQGIEVGKGGGYMMP